MPPKSPPFSQDSLDVSGPHLIHGYLAPTCLYTKRQLDRFIRVCSDLGVTSRVTHTPTIKTTNGRTYTHTHPFNGHFSGTTQVSRYQKGKTNLDFTETRDSEWQWHQLEHMQICTSLQTDNHASTPPLAGCPSCRPTNSVKAVKDHTRRIGKFLGIPF